MTRSQRSISFSCACALPSPARRSSAAFCRCLRADASDTDTGSLSRSCLLNASFARLSRCTSSASARDVEALARISWMRVSCAAWSAAAAARDRSSARLTSTSCAALRAAASAFNSASARAAAAATSC